MEQKDEVPVRCTHRRTHREAGKDQRQSGQSNQALTLSYRDISLSSSRGVVIWGQDMCIDNHPR